VEDDDEARLLIEDDGVGFDPGGVHVGQHGLRKLRERVSRLGGQLWLDSAPGAGTVVRISIPATGAAGEARERRSAR
jgi:signal transduction histidine kinase